jgi:hypothetical protein
LQTRFGIIAIAIISMMFLGFQINEVFAEEISGYLMAEDISAHLTFTFRDGVETHEFPVFKTTDFIANKGTAFQVQGVIADAPYLHKALDEAFKFRLDTTGTGYNYQFFDVDVEFTYASGEYDVHHLVYQVKGGDDDLIPNDVEPRTTLHYTDCQIEDYLFDTAYNTYRPYSPSETGFAIVETIEFLCAGIQSEVTSQSDLSYATEPGIINDFGKLDYKYADDIRTFVTFEFDNGIEKIEFPIFKTISGFAEDDNPSFHVEGVVNRYPLLASAIDNARDTRNLALGANVDFNANVEFVQETRWGGEKLLRGINYEDCLVNGSDFTTYYDNEEGYVSAGGYGIMHTIDFNCAGMNPQNPRYDVNMETNEQTRNYNMASGPRVITEFRYHDNTIETIEFPIFRQQDILSKSNPTFQLEGMVGDYPLLYQQVDDAAKINQITGVTQIHELFDVDVNLKYDENAVRGFSYSGCRVTDYVVATEHQNEEGFWVGFALENTFEFECLGYHPKNTFDDEIFEPNIEDKTSTWAGLTFDGYLQAEDVSANLTFTFRDGVETHEFPVFITTADFAENTGTSFQVQGVVADTPHLHKALDEAFKYRTAKGSSFDYNYKYFDVEAVITSNDNSRIIFYYVDCQIANYLVDTLSHTHRGYLSTNTGFAIVETIDFQCNGLHSETTNQGDLSYRTEPGIINDFGKLDYKYADDIRTFVTFEFDNGIEKIEFPIFKTVSGFAEDDNPSFHVEGVANRYPLLASAIDNARDNRNLALGTNVDFNANVEFVQGTIHDEKLLRGIYYEDCNVNGSDITTYYDTEEPYATVGGFAINHSIDFDCAGMNPSNPLYDESMTTNEQSRNYKMASGIHAIAEFKFKDNTIETIDFPIFRHQDILSKSDVTFQLKGMVGDYPLLYKQVDLAAKINQIGGPALRLELFDVDVNLKYDEQTVRGFSYSDCRVVDYVVATQQGNEEAFFFWFALETTFEFECLGYQPKNPVYDVMFETEKAATISTLDLRETDTWPDEFKYKPKK